MKPFISFLRDMTIWGCFIVLVGFLQGAGLVQDRGVALASGALWLAIRAFGKAEENIQS